MTAPSRPGVSTTVPGIVILSTPYKRSAGRPMSNYGTTIRCETDRVSNCPPMSDTIYLVPEVFCKMEWHSKSDTSNSHAHWGGALSSFYSMLL